MSRLHTFLLFFLPVIYFDCVAQPIALHPDNTHYFLFKNKPAVLITSGEHYGALLNLDFDFKKYFSELRSDNLNMTRIFSGVYCEQPGAFNINANTLAPAPEKYITPWARSKTPGYRNGGNKFDLHAFDNKYFERLKEVVTDAALKNIVVEFTLFCPFYEDAMWVLSPMHPSNNVNNTPDIPRTDVYTLEKNGALLEIQKNVVREIVKQLNNFDNVIFEICNEPYFGGVTMEWQHAIADVIAATEKDLPKKHLISQNIQNGASKVTDPHPSVSVYNWHYAYPPSVVPMNYHLQKPIGDNETGFRGVSDSTYRFEGWKFITAGGALFNHLDYSFAVGHENGDYEYSATQPGGGSKALRQQLSHLKRFIEKFDYVKMKPDSSVLQTTVTYNCISENGKQYAMYFSGSLGKQIRMNIPTGKYRATWVHPITGKEQSTTVEAKNDSLTLTVPQYNEDIALALIKII